MVDSYLRPSSSYDISGVQTVLKLVFCFSLDQVSAAVLDMIVVSVECSGGQNILMCFIIITL